MPEMVTVGFELGVCFELGMLVKTFLRPNQLGHVPHSPANFSSHTACSAGVRTTNGHDILAILLRFFTGRAGALRAGDLGALVVLLVISLLEVCDWMCLWYHHVWCFRLVCSDVSGCLLPVLLLSRVSSVGVECVGCVMCVC